LECSKLIYGSNGIAALAIALVPVKLAFGR